MRVGLVMFYDNAIQNYGDLNYIMNSTYCEKYNLEIILSKQKKYARRHSAWERLPLLLEHIEKFDYLIWIDADAFFHKEANNIVDIITKYPEANFIFSNDLGDKNINTGLFIVKNSKYSIDFLTKWAYDETLYINNTCPPWWDQGVLIDMFNQNVLNIKQNSIIFVYGFLQHFHENDKLQETYVFHLAGKKSDVRYQISRKYFNIMYNLNTVV